MTIEKSPPSTEPKAAGASDTKTSKVKPGSAGANDASALGGFMAILSAVDTSDATTLVDGDAQDALADAAKAAALAALGDQTDGTATGAPGSGLDSAALLAQTLQMLPTAPTSQSDLPRTDALGNAPALVDGKAWGQALAGVPAAGSATASAPGSSSAASAQGLGVSDEPTSPLARKPTALAKPKADALETGQGAASNTPAQMQAPSGMSAALEARIAALAQKAQATPSAAMATPAIAAMAANLMRPQGEGQERSVFKVGATEAANSTAASGATSAAFAQPATPQLGTTSAGVAAAPVEVYLAEQVKYWISNDVKNAEMKLEGLGNELVEVSISMHGSEAHVAFRTDEVQARSALESAANHLKDMMAREGVLLSGVSVGTSGSQNPDAQERRARQNGARQATVVSGVAASGGAAAAKLGGVLGGGGAGRALDLFV